MQNRTTLSLNLKHREPAQPLIYIGRHAPFERHPAMGFRPATSPEPAGTSQRIATMDDAGLVTIAGTGAGKGVSQVIPTLLTYSGSAIVVDPKGEIHAVTARRRREMGQHVVRLNPFGDGSSSAINPLDLISGRAPSAVDDCYQLARQMVGSSLNNDPFWDDTARRLIAGTLLFIVTHLPSQYRELVTLRRIWFASEEDLASILGAMSMSDAHDGLVRETAEIYLAAPDRTRASILTTLREHLSFLASRRGTAGLRQNGMDLKAHRDRVPMTVYLTVPPQYLASHAKLLRIWIGTLISSAVRRKTRPAIPDLFLIDEAAQLGRLDELLVAASLLRGYGIRTWTFWQSIGQIEQLYGARGREFLDNAGAISMFGVGNASVAAAITAVTGYDGQILGLPPDRQIIALSGEPAREVAKVNYLRDAEYAGLWDADPFHTSMPQPREAGDERGR